MDRALLKRYPWLTVPAQVLARTAWGTDHADGVQGMQAIINVIMNRVNNPNRWGKSVVSVCLKPDQFPVWNPLTVGNDRDRDTDRDDDDDADDALPAATQAMLDVNDDDPAFRAAVDLAQAAIGLRLPDITGGADCFLPAAEPEPEWTLKAGLLTTIGAFKYYRLD